jgi:hypothetical protein
VNTRALPRDRVLAEFSAATDKFDSCFRGEARNRRVPSNGISEQSAFVKEASP